MREETEYRPKPMVEVGGKPVLWHIMKTFAHHGCNEFVLCLGYKGEIIKEYFYNFHALNNDFTVKLGRDPQFAVHGSEAAPQWTVTLVDTGREALKGARLKRAEHYIDGDEFMVAYGDSVADIDVRKLLEFHRSHGRMATISGVRPPSRFGELLLKNRKVTTFSEKPAASADVINGGFMVFQKKVLDLLTKEDSCDLEYGLMQTLARKGELMAYDHQGQWECMDTYRDMVHLNKLWEQGQAFWKVWRDE
jgi:glucose-1-phosphate cytidylyltransferase